MIRNLIYCVLISLVLLTPFMYSDELYNGTITAKQIWFYGAMGLLIFGFALENLFTRKRFPLRLNPIDISLLVFYSYFFIRACYTPYTPILYNQKFLNYSLLILFYFIVKYACCRVTISKNNLFSGGNYPVIATITLVLMLTGAMEAIWGLLQLYGFTRSFHSGFKITGTFFNPAPYALYLTVIFPIALTVLVRERNIRNKKIIKNEGIKELKNERIKRLLNSWIEELIHLLISRYKLLKNKYTENPNSFILSFLHSFIRFIAWLTVVSILLVLPATMNRASWVGVGVSSFFIFNQKYYLIGHLRRWLKTGIRKTLVATGLLIFVVTIVVGLFQLKKGSSTGRLFIWEVTAGKMAEKPLFGYGVGRFEAEYNNWQAEYFQNHTEEMDGPKGMAAGNTKYCFNEYLEMASEIGIIGLFLFLMIFLSLLISSKFILKHFNHFVQSPLFPISFSSDNSFAFLFIYSLISVFVCGLISFPFYSLSTLIVLFLLISVISSELKGVQVIKVLHCKTVFQYGIKSISSFLLILSVYLLLILAKEQYEDYFTVDEGVKLYQIQSYKESCNSFEKVYSSLKYNGPYLQYYGKALSMVADYDKSAEILEQARHFTSDEVLYTNIGNSYEFLKKYSEAESAFLHASTMVPHKLYPLYLLAKLYEKTGEETKTTLVVKKVLSKRIKVNSSATKEIASEMRSFIEKPGREQRKRESLELNGKNNR